MKNPLMEKIRKTSDLIKLVESRGYKCTSRKGSHAIFRMEGKPSLSIPDKREISPGVLREILKLANIY